MLPLQQAYETREAIIEYLKATFNFKEKEVNPYTRCVRIADYRTTWAHFEKIFNR
ncbi:MAG: hypothetical protein IK017_10870 [Paludibacteraceae bacterium]|nr:hypothetical protein [Paludibacteraceae bacterium]